VDARGGEAVAPIGPINLADGKQQKDDGKHRLFYCALLGAA
jgi:hypothetical protein